MLSAGTSLDVWYLCKQECIWIMCVLLWRILFKSLLTVGSLYNFDEGGFWSNYTTSVKASSFSSWWCGILSRRWNFSQNQFNRIAHVLLHMGLSFAVIIYTSSSPHCSWAIWVRFFQCNIIVAATMFPALREHLFSWWDPETKCSPQEVWDLKLYVSSMCLNTHKIFAKFRLEKLY
jgi:hypothetical protein